MTFLLDQDAPDDLAYSLRALGYEVVHSQRPTSKFDES
jgi:hypothetical protein